MKNQEIRETAKKAGVKLWQIADELGILDVNFSKLLRHELSEEKKAEICSIIAKIEREEKKCQ